MGGVAGHAGLFATAWGDGTYWNYFYFPDGYTINMMIEHVTTWAVAGLGIAAVVKPKG